MGSTMKHIQTYSWFCVLSLMDFQLPRTIVDTKYMYTNRIDNKAKALTCCMYVATVSATPLGWNSVCPQ